MFVPPRPTPGDYYSAPDPGDWDFGSEEWHMIVDSEGIGFGRTLEEAIVAHKVSRFRRRCRLNRDRALDVGAWPGIAQKFFRQHVQRYA